ncbi:MAG: hypothetical protein H6622_14565 [Halobacteriovoraceae bacterium]|nr:hypothetical protein [Halobacteriovoraceae bacterium]
MTAENISLIIFGVGVLYVFSIPLINKFYLDKKYPKIKRNVIYDLPNVPHSDDRSFHRFCAYITVFLLHDKNKQRYKNLLAQYFKPEINVSKLAKFGTWERVFGIINLSIGIIIIVDMIIAYILTNGWPINLFYGIERKMSLQQQKSFGALFIFIAFFLIRWVYKFIKKLFSK